MIKKEANPKTNILEIRPGDTIQVYQIIKESIQRGKKRKKKEGEKEKIQIFEGLVLARKHGKEAGATITVRKVISGIGVEKIFPIHSPLIKDIKIIKRAKVRRAKLNYLRTAKGKRARLKTLSFLPQTPKGKVKRIPEEEGKQEPSEKKKVVEIERNLKKEEGLPPKN